jgi:glutamine synthetase
MNITLEYIWVDGHDQLRSKTKIYEEQTETITNNLKQALKNKNTDRLNNRKYLSELNILKLIPDWNFDGSSTNQAIGKDSEVILRPVRIYLDVFRKNGFLVLCETWTSKMVPHETNTRNKALRIFSKFSSEEAWFGIEQEFFMINTKNGLPIGFNNDGSAHPQGRYYCSVGAGKCFGRDFAEEVLENCLNTNLNITGLNFEVAPGQCELQLRDEGIKAADDLIILRYILLRTGEKFDTFIDLRAKPIKGDWNGSGCHVNFSTKNTRQENGLKLIYKMMDKLKRTHDYHISNYGNDNAERLTGKHETSSMDKFSYGTADRTSSIRIPKSTVMMNKGYFEDRRPSSSMDPYKVLSILLQTCCEENNRDETY